jgi:anti-sigma regulatory factor (Ser/Thr protein kinase)
METLISSLLPQLVFPINHASDIAAARRAGQKLADELGFDEVQAGRLAIVITEAGTNILKHAGEGTLYVMRAQSGAAMAGIDVLAVDNGPASPTSPSACRTASPPPAPPAPAWARCAASPTSSTSGRTRQGRGLLHAPVARQPAARALRHRGRGAVRAAGRRGRMRRRLGRQLRPRRRHPAGVDGLGHGPEAAKAARAAIDALERAVLGAGRRLQAAHEALRITRGAALSVARIDYAGNDVRFAGIGNVSGVVIDGATRRALISHNGIVGANMRKVQEFTVDCPPGAL